MNGRNTPVLETERLILRKFTENDFSALFEIYSDIDVNTYLPWFPLKSMEETKTFYEERYAKIYAQPCGYRYAICFKNDDIPIGYVNVSTDDSHDLGYGLQKKVLAPRDCQGSDPSGCGTSEKGWAIVYYSNARHQKPAQRQCNEGSWNEISIFV